MKFGTFYEHQLPRPWKEGDEQKLFQNALDQVELADRLGIDHMWEVEHHFLEEYAHSSAPEIFLAACSQRTKRIRLGHGIVLLPPNYNHPARDGCSWAAAIRFRAPAGCAWCAGCTRRERSPGRRNVRIPRESDARLPTCGRCRVGRRVRPGRARPETVSAPGPA